MSFSDVDIAGYRRLVKTLAEGSYDYGQLLEILNHYTDEQVTVFLRSLGVLCSGEHFSFDHSRRKIILHMVVSEGSKDSVPVALERFGIKFFVPIDPDDIPEAIKPRGVIEITET